MAVQNPLSGLIEGLLQGHNLAQQIKRQAMEEEAFKTNQALHQRQMTIQDIMNQQALAGMGRPVDDMGTVEDFLPAAPKVPGQPQMEGGNPRVPFRRVADRKRTVEYNGRKTELFTPEEQQQRSIERQVNDETALATAKGEAQQRVRGNALKLRGVATPDDIRQVLRLPEGHMSLPEEIPGLAKEAMDVLKSGRVDLGPGHQLIDATGTPGPDGKPRVIASAPHEEDAKTRAARTYIAAIRGKKPEDVDPKELAEGVGLWEQATMNPLDKALKEEDVKTAPLNRKVKESTLQTQAMERTVKQHELDLADDGDTINLAANKYLQTGQMPALGMGSAVLRGKIMGRAAQIAKDAGIAPENVPALQDTYKSLSATLTDLQKRKGQLLAFEEGGARNLDNFIALAKKQVDAKSPIVNRIVRGAARTVAGSEDQAAADVARVAAYNEISKILSGSLGNAGVSDAARHEAEGLLKGDYNMKQLLKVAEVLRTDMKNRSQAYTDQIDQTRTQMQGLTKPAAAAAPGGAAAQPKTAEDYLKSITGAK